jgi:natural product biosynthesis luciferase-like monooxygenase protein/amino acid adenylation domain-containing protein/FkbM family methyltransferase
VAKEIFVIPASYNQRGLWFLEQLEPGTARYNISACVRLRGALNFLTLEQSLNEIVRRHEILRTVFNENNGEPVQVISTDARLFVKSLDLLRLSQEEREAEARGLVVEESRRPFDLAREQLLRVTLLGLGCNEHVLIITMHHIISDGWSIGVFIREMVTLYEVFSKGRPSPLADCPIQYADFAIWQREYLTGDVLDNLAAYWKTRLRDNVATLDLATDYPRSVANSARSASEPVIIPELAHDAIKELSRRNGVTPFMALLAAFQTLLYRYTHQEDIVVGTPVSGRDHHGFDDLIGFFVNTLVIRTDLSGNPSFNDLLRRVRNIALEAYAHQDLPFEKLVEEIQPDRDIGHTPLFQVMFALNNTPQQVLEVSGLTLNLQELDPEAAKFDLMLWLMDRGREFKGDIHYRPALFHLSTISRMVGHFHMLLRDAIANPDRPISHLALLTEAETHQLLVEWNNTQSDYPRHKCIHGLFEEQVKRSPDAIAVVCEEKQLTYNELNRRANQVAHYLNNAGVKPESAVGICIERSAEMIVGMLGTLKAGGAYVPLDPAYPGQRLTYMLEDAGALVVLSQAKLEAKLPANNAKITHLDGEWEHIKNHNSDNFISCAAPDNIAYIIYTSGSTGRPRGVAIKHHSAVALIHWASKLFGYDELQGMLASTSICFDLSVFELFVPLSLGGKVIVVENALHIAEITAKEEIKIINTVPSAMAELVKMDAIPSSVTTVNLAGEPLQRKLVDEIYARGHVERVINLYGPTEDTTYSTAEWIEKSATEAPAIGRPIANTQAYVFDKYMQSAAIGMNGELYIGGEGVALGYLHRGDATAERFIPNPFSACAGARMYRTGDLVRYKANGKMDYLGRIDHQVKVRGFRIEMGEIEALLNEHPAVGESVVVAVGDQTEGKRIVAYIVSPHRQWPGVDEFRIYLKQRLPEYMLPSAYVQMDYLPLTPNGKIDRLALPQAPQLQQGEKQTPRTPIEDIVASIWADLIGCEHVGIEESFFELGGHSLLAIRVISRLRDVFGVELGVRRMFETPTVAGLAVAIEEAFKGDGAIAQTAIAKASADAVLELSSGQERIWFLDQLSPNSATYNIAGMINLRGELNEEALKSSYCEVIRRHESLRTRFEKVEGRPAQIVEPEVNAEIPIVDISCLEEEARGREAERIGREMGRRGFHLNKGQLIRAALIKESESVHGLVIVMHHIISDGWSLGIMMREMGHIYQARRRGERVGLKDLKIQYADYAQWERRRVAGEEVKRQMEYWKLQLGTDHRVLDLPLDRPRPALQTYQGARQFFKLSAERSGQLKAIGRGESATFYMVLLAALKALLFRLSGQRQISVGAAAANRNRVETEEIIGLFVNTLVMRTDLSGRPGFRELLRRVRSVAIGAYANQEAPFEKLVEHLQLKRELSHSPLFQVMFLSQTPAVEVLRLDGLTLNLKELETETAKYDLTLYVEEAGDELKGWLEYNKDLYDEETIVRMTSYYARLLEQIVAQPDVAIDELEYLTQQEREQLLVKLNDTKSEYRKNVCVHQLIEEQVGKTPDAVALICEEHYLTYGKLNRRANQVAHYLSQVGVVPESVVGICVGRSVEMVVGMLGTLKAGGAYVPLDPTYPQQRLVFMVKDAQIRLVLTEDPFTDIFREQAIRTLCFDTDWDVIIKRSEDNLCIRTSPGNLGYVIYTSGSTGMTKGVMVTHENVSNFFTGMDGRVGGNPAGVWLAVTSISFDISVLELLWTLARGFRVVIQTEYNAGGEIFNPSTAVAHKPMEYSLFYFASDDETLAENKYRLLLEGAMFADRHGFSAVWTPERHFHHFGGLYPNPSVTGAALATITERVRIRAGSVVLPLHNPIRVAEEWSVVDNLSNGRVDISFASGWHANDFVFAPDNYENRKGIMVRDIETVRKLWRGEAIYLQGGAGNQVEVAIWPRPVQKELPIWLTAAGSPDTFRTAGEIGAHLLTHLLGQSVEELADKIAIYRDAWQKRRSGTGHVTLMLHTFVGPDMQYVREKVREPFCDYLESSAELMMGSAQSLGKNINHEDFTVEDRQAVLSHAFARYFHTSGLFGTPDHCRAMVDKLRAIGVDEVACLIDFGVDADSVISGLSYLDMVKRQSDKSVRGRADDYTLPTQITRHNVTHLQCTPAMARMLMMQAEFLNALGSLQLLMLGGESLPSSLANHLRETMVGEIHNMYGPTETTVWSTTCRVTATAHSVAIGRPIANTQLYILDGNLQPIPRGVPGELFIGGAGVVRGYLNRPELTADRFMPNPFVNEPGLRLYKTSDLVRCSADENMEFLGRTDHQVKISGYRIELGEVETALSRHPDVKEAVVVARNDEYSNSQLVAYVVPKRVSDKNIKFHTPADQKSALGGRRPYKLPNGMVIANLSDFQTNVAYIELFENEVYLKHGITIREGDCIFDVGANIGLFTLYANRKHKDLTIYAFEPIPPTFDVLRTNVALHGVNVKLFDCGISNKTESSVFTFYPEMPGLSGRYGDPERDNKITGSIIRNWLRNEASDKERGALSKSELDELLQAQFRAEQYTCQVRTLSEIIRENYVERIDLLKIDAERSEYDVLCGIEEEDWKKIGQIVVEIDTKESLDKITALLNRRGYNFKVDEIHSIEGDGEVEGVAVYMLYATASSRFYGPRGGNGNGERRGAPPEPVESGLSVSLLRGFLKQQLPEYMIPSAFMLIDSLPLTPNGKIDRNALPEIEGVRPELEVKYIAPQTDVESQIASIWREMLGIEKVGIHDNFFEAGGTSLLLVQVNDRLRKSFGKTIPIVEMFRHPTVNSLANYLSHDRDEPSSTQRIQERAGKQTAALKAKQLIRNAAKPNNITNKP